MDKQKLFTNAWYEYMNELKDLEEMAGQDKEKKKMLYYGYDITLQLALIQMITLDDNISSVEIEFVEHIIDDNDLFKIYRKKTGKVLGWNNLVNVDDIKRILHSVMATFTIDLVNFIKEFISIDFNTREDYLNRLKGNIYYISQAILEVDGFDPKEKKAYEVLDNTLFKKMDDLKNIALKSNEFMVGENIK